MKYLKTFEKIIIGKLGKNKSLEEIAKMHGVSLDDIIHQLSIGKKIEMEHTNDISIAMAIAKDHLVESPTYYTDLKKIEK